MMNIYQIVLESDWGGLQLTERLESCRLRRGVTGYFNSKMGKYRHFVSNLFRLLECSAHVEHDLASQYSHLEE